jgi:hypothetical protein
MQYTQFGKLKVSKFIIGGNPFTGFSHQNVEQDKAMLKYFTCAKIKETLAEAEKLGINTFVGRADNHIIRMLMEYWNEGGKIQWFAQTCPEHRSPEYSAQRAIEFGAKACHIHGGTMDYYYAQGKLDEAKKTIKLVRDAGLLASVAGHRPHIFHWAKDNLDLDYYMCSYYDPSPRDNRPEHVTGIDEYFREDDRKAMVETIAGLSKSVVHYKIMACGRHNPAEAFAYAAKNMRDFDAVCVGICQKDLPTMLADDVRLLEKSLAEVKNKGKKK